jgi:hypothetical protein
MGFDDGAPSDHGPQHGRGEMPRVIGNLAAAAFLAMLATYALFGMLGLLEMGAEHFFSDASQDATLLPTLMRGVFVLVVFIACCRVSWRLLNRVDAEKHR